MQMFMPKLCTKSMDNIPTIFADEPQLIENTENLESCLETPKHVRSASEARVYDQQWLLYDSKIGKRGEPKKVGSGYVLYAVQRVSKTASKAAENSGQSPRNLLCTGKIVVEVVEELPCASSPTPSLPIPPSKLIGSVRGALHLHSIWMDNYRRSLKSCCLFSNRSCASSE
jgi:hypothetical protein